MTVTGEPLAGRAALVTGGNRGLGRAFALRLAQLGCNVAICDADLKGHLQYELDRNLTGGLSVDRELRQLGVDSFAVEQDAADFGGQRALADSMLDRWGRIDIVVCNAGGSVGLPGVALGPSVFASQIDPTELDLILRRNLVATVATCVAVAPGMKATGSGSIVTVGSVNGLEALPSGASAHYGAAKAAVIMYTRYLAQELGPYGIRVNCIAPGTTVTGRMRSVFDSPASSQFGSYESSLEDRNPMHRVGEVEYCADALEFLCTDKSSFFSGHVLAIDGGEVRGAT